MAGRSEPAAQTADQRYGLLFVLIVMPATWVFTAVCFSDSARIHYFYLAMFIPASVGLALNLMRYRSIGRALEPLTIRMSLKAVVLSLAYPLAIIAAVAGAVVALGLARFDAAKSPGCMTSRCCARSPSGSC